MDDEPLILEWEFAGIDGGMKALQDLAKEVRVTQKAVDDYRHSVEALNQELHAMPSQMPKSSGVGIPMPSIASPHSLPSLPAGPADLMGTLGKAGSLISDLGSMAGVAEAALMEFAGPLAAAVIVVDLMAGAAKHAAESITAFSSAMITSGGSAKETGLLQGLGDAVGVKDTAGLARQLSDRLSSGGRATAFGAQAGIHDFGLYDQTDKAQNLIKALDYIRTTPNKDDATRFARVEGLDDFLKMRDISEDMYQNFKKSAEASSVTKDPAAAHNAEAYNVEIARAGREWERLKMQFEQPFLPGITSLVTLGGTALHELNGGLDRFGKWWDHLMGADDKDKEKNHAEDRHTQALNRHADALLKQGTYGGGQRARNAIPAAWGGANARNWDGQARALGSML